MPEKNDTAYNRILGAAVESLEEYGLHGATTRVIAEKADVNIASINYYFRSKENLLAMAVETLLDRNFDWDVLEEPDDMDIKDRLVYGLNMLMEGTLNYDEHTGAFFVSVMNSSLNTLILQRIHAFMRRVVDELCNKDGQRDRAAVEVSVSQVFSAVLLPGMIMPGIFDGYNGIDLLHLKTRLQYIRNAVDKLL
ncbi:MAG: TetR/AcrR family transcriptional regulator [Bacillota bacterium]